MNLFSRKPNINKLRRNNDVAGLIGTLNYKDLQIANYAAHSLDDWFVDDVQGLMTALGNAVGRGLSDEITDNLQEALSSKDGFVPFAATRILIAPLERSVPLLIAALSNSDPDVRITAAGILEAKEDTRAINPLSASLVRLATAKGEKAKQEQQIMSKALKHLITIEQTE